MPESGDITKRFDRLAMQEEIQNQRLGNVEVRVAELKVRNENAVQSIERMEGNVSQLFAAVKEMRKDFGDLAIKIAFIVGGIQSVMSLVVGLVVWLIKVNA